MPSLDDLNAALVKADAAGDTQSAQIFAGQIKQMRASAAPAPRQQAPGGVSDSLSNGVVNTVTGGLATPALSALEAGLSHITPGPVETYAQRLAANQGQQQQTAAAHPVASIAGDVGGAAVLSPLLSAAMPFKAALALKAGSKVANVARVAAQGALQGGEYGAAAGAVKGATQGDGVTGTAEDAAGGGLEGAGLGAAGGLAAAGVAAAVPAVKAVFSDAGKQSIALLAKAFGVSPADMATVYTKFKADAGRAPAMGELTDLFNRGEIARMVGKNPKLGGAVAQATQDASAALPARLNETVADTIGKTPVLKSPLGPNVAGMGEDAADLVTARDSNMKAAMGPIRQTPIPLDPAEVEFLRGEVLPHAGMTRLGRKAVHDDLDLGQLSVGNADTLRQNLNARAVANPGEGFGEIAKGLTQMATDASPEYRAALDGYARDSNYIDAHAHGMTGKTPGQTQDALLIKSLQTPEGREGYKSGLVTRMGNQAFDSEQGAASTAADLSQQASTSGHLANTFSPITVDKLRAGAAAQLGGVNSLKAIASGSTAAPAGPNVGQAALAAVSHSWPMKVYHAIKAHVGAGMPDNVARITAKYLTDPQMSAQGINLMYRHGVDAATTRKLVQKAIGKGALAAASAGN